MREVDKVSVLTSAPTGWSSERIRVKNSQIYSHLVRFSQMNDRAKAEVNAEDDASVFGGFVEYFAILFRAG